MFINKHSSFYLRDGWATKILTSVNENEYIFSPANELTALDTFGVGKIMVKSLRYWSVATGLTTEKKISKGIVHTKTDLFNILLEKDRYFFNKASLILLHRNIVKDSNNSTAIYWFFNIYDKKSITKEEFTQGLYSYLVENGCSYSKDMVSKEWGCITNMYSKSKASNIDKVIEDENTSMLSRLELLRQVSSTTYEKTSLKLNDISPYVILYCILEDNKDKTQISIDTLVEEENQIGKYLNLSYSDIIMLLQILENEKYLKVTNNHGSRYIDFNHTNENILKKIYY